jgi:hypothetical protein
MITILAVYMLTVSPVAPDYSWLEDLQQTAPVVIVAEKKKINLQEDDE